MIVFACFVCGLVGWLVGWLVGVGFRTVFFRLEATALHPLHQVKNQTAETLQFEPSEGWKVSKVLCRSPAASRFCQIQPLICSPSLAPESVRMRRASDFGKLSLQTLPVRVADVG